jgi:hypothetical protein
MSNRLPKWQLHQILIAFLFDWTVKYIAAATKLHLLTIYRIQLNLDLYREPYPPPNLKIRRLSNIPKEYKQVRDI